MATPLKHVRGLGAAHRGTETFWRQRVTAIANIPLVIFLVLSIVSHIGASYGEVKAYLAQPLVTLAMLALVDDQEPVAEPNDDESEAPGRNRFARHSLSV